MNRTKRHNSIREFLSRVGGTPFGSFVRQLQKSTKGLAKPSHGFSLIEVLVSLSIFTVVVTISVSALYALIEANSRTRNAQSIATNLSFTLDSMTREIRTGRDFYCLATSGIPPYEAYDAAYHPTQNCDVAPGVILSFNEGGRSLTNSTSNNSRRIAYQVSDGKLQRRLGAGDWEDLTADDVTITQLEFYVDGAHPGEADADGPGGSDALSPLVTIFLAGEVDPGEAAEKTFSIQATIPQRLLDI